MPLKPLVAKVASKNRSEEWSRAVFATYGRRCWIHLRRDPKSKVAATDPAHVIKRSRMGAAIAYGPKDGPVEPRLGRPLCRTCHVAQEAGIEKEDRFSYEDMMDATLAHNSYARSHLPLPAREDYP